MSFGDVTAGSAYTPATTVERVTFRDAHGRLHRWPAARVSTAKDGRMVATRVADDGTSYGSTMRYPGQYFIDPANIVSRT